MNMKVGDAVEVQDGNLNYPYCAKVLSINKRERTVEIKYDICQQVSIVDFDRVTVIDIHGGRPRRSSRESNSKHHVMGRASARARASPSASPSSISSASSSASVSVSGNYNRSKKGKTKRIATSHCSNRPTTRRMDPFILGDTKKRRRNIKIEVEKSTTCTTHSCKNNKVTETTTIEKSNTYHHDDYDYEEEEDDFDEEEEEIKIIFRSTQNTTTGKQLVTKMITFKHEEEH